MMNLQKWVSGSKVNLRARRREFQSKKAPAVFVSHDGQTYYISPD